MFFSELAKYMERLELTTSRMQLIAILASLFKKTSSDEIDKVIYLIQGRLWPEWFGEEELGLGEKLIIKAISLASNTSEYVVEQTYKKYGDLGKAAEVLKQKGRSSVGLVQYMQTAKGGLTVSYVYSSLVKIAKLSGEGSRDMKIKILAGLLRDASPIEARYIVRLIDGNLRLGVGDATIMDALALAFTGSEASRSVIERAYNIRADLGNVAKTLATKGLDALKKIEPEVGIPVRPMLAERLDNAREILEKTGGVCLVEFKYDGERVQIHKKGSRVILYSRRLENITHQYPDVVEMCIKHLKADSIIVEGEVIAVDPETYEFRPFQELMHRKRKHNIEEIIKEYPVVVRLFDLLYVDGIDATTLILPERRKLLEKHVDQVQEFSIAEYEIVDNEEDIDKFFMKAIESGCEGIVAKAIHKESIYQAGARGWLWIKYKRDYKSEMIDSVDLTVVGAFYGRGRRAGKFGTVLLAAYDPENDVFKTVCKVGTGFTDQDLVELNNKLSKLISRQKPARVVAEIEPDVWVVPELVMEVIGAEITLSPVHTCCKGMVKKDAGLSIRFPRFIRWRPDKRPEDSTTEKEIYDMYLKQLRKVESVQHEER